MKIKRLALAGALMFGVGSELVPVEAIQVLQETSPLAWSDEKWTSNDKRLLQIKRNVELEIRKNKEPKKLVSTYKSYALKHSDMPEAAFKWGYAAWRTQNTVSSYADRWNLLDPAREALETTPIKNSYEYTRLRYLLTCYAGTNQLRLIALGERLLKKSPKDFDVKRVYIVSYNAMHPPIAIRKRLVSLAQELVKDNPGRDSYATLGGVLLGLWGATQDKRHAEQTIAAYRNFLRVAPNDWWAPQARRLIQSVQSGLSKSN